MKTKSLMPTILSVLLCSVLFPVQSIAQNAGKCGAQVLAMNMTPLAANAELSVKKPCKKETLKINQSPRSNTATGSIQYNNIAFDQLDQPFINQYPEMNGSCDKKGKTAQQGSPTGQQDKAKQLTACKNQEKKEAESKTESPKRVRPSATVKLVKYD